MAYEYEDATVNVDKLLEPQEEPPMWKRALKALDFTANVGRSFIAGLPENKGLSNAYDAAFEGLETPAEDLRYKLLRGLGVKSGSTDSAVGDFIIDFAIDAALDPLTYLTFGAAPAAKLAKGANLLAKTGKALEHGLTVGKYAGGAAVGVAAAPEKADPLEKLVYGAIGTAAVKGASKLLSPAIAAKDLEKSLAFKTLGGYKGLTEIASKSVKGEQILKTFGENAPQMITAAKDWGDKLNKSRAMLGALYGYGSTNENDPLYQRIGTAALGYAGMHNAGKVTGSLLKYGNKMGDSAVDLYYLNRFGLRKGDVIANPEKATINAMATRTGKTPQDVMDRLKFEKNNVTNIDDIENLTPMYDTIKSKLTTDLKMDPSEALNNLSSVKEKYDYVYRSIVAGKEDLLKKIPSEERVLVESFMHNIKNKSVMKRNELIKQEEARLGRQLNANEFNDITKQSNDFGTHEAVKAAAGGNENIYAIADALASHNEKIIKRYNQETLSNVVGLKWHVDDVFNPKDWYEFADIAESFNPEKIKLHMVKGSYDEFGKLLNPLKVPAHLAYSEPEKYKQIIAINNQARAEKIAAAKELRKSIGEKWSPEEFKDSITKISSSIDNKYKDVARPIADSMKASEEGYKKAYDLYARKMAFAHLDKTERNVYSAAQQLSILKDAALQTGKIDKILKGFDGFTNYIKANLLGTSLQWLSTSYWDNIGKAYMQSGVPAALQTSVAQVPLLGKILNPISRDIDKVIKNKKVPIPETILDDMTKRGVFETMYKQTHEEQQLEDIVRKGYGLYKQYRNKPEGFLANMKDAAIKTAQRKPIEALKSLARGEMSVLEKTTLNLGASVDAQARAITYMHTYEGLKSSGMLDYIYKNAPKDVISSGVDAMKWADDKVKDIAARMTKDTFFDYKKVSEFERAVAKRIVPFWTFYSRNIPYWISNISDVNKAGKIANIERIRRNIGSGELTPGQLKEMPPWVKNFPVKRITPEFPGDISIMDPTRMSSMYEFLNVNDPISSKINPIIKNLYEVATNQDLFLKEPLSPLTRLSKIDKRTNYATEEGKKYMFDRGRTLSKIQELTGVDLGMRHDLKPTMAPNKESHYTLSGSVPAISKVADIALPMLAGVDRFNKIFDSDKSLMQEILAQTIPVKKRTITSEQREYYGRK